MRSPAEQVFSSDFWRRLFGVANDNAPVLTAPTGGEFLPVAKAINRRAATGRREKGRK